MPKAAKTESLRAAVLAMIGDGRRISAGAIARDMDASEDALIAWLKGEDRSAIETIVSKWVEMRAGWKAASKQDVKAREDLRRALMLGMERDNSRLAGFIGSRDAAITEQHARLLMADLEEVIRDGETPHECWRCGASLGALPSDISKVIAENETSAAWVGWMPDLFRAKCRMFLKKGDRIVAIDAGKVRVRRPDGSLFNFSRFDG